MAILLDPPVSMFSTVDEIESWRVQLKEMRVQNVNDSQALESIERADNEAARWIALQQAEDEPRQEGL